MTRTNKLLANVVKKMHQNFFDIDAGGILVYRDPTIGQLENQSKQLVVKLDASKAALELNVQGRVVQVFELAGRVEKACQEAFGAYFTAFEQLCQKQADLQAAA